MKKWWADFVCRRRKRRDQKQLSRNTALFNVLVKDPRSGMDRVLQAHANRLARAKMMNWMDARGTSHCRFCEVTAPLRVMGKAYFCDTHFPRQATAAVKP